MPKLDRTAVLFSVNCFAAACLALAIGFALDLPRPYWAVLTVYITSQPLSGGVRSKALYRLIGTLSGAGFTVLVLPPLVDSPLLLSAVLAAWVGVCLGISLLDRTPRAYLLMLAGYTATLIGFPSVGHPEQIFEVAVSRVEEISLGILCATVTHSLFFPRPVGTVLKMRLVAWLKDADAWALDLMRRDDGKAVTDRRHLAAAATEIHLLSLLLPFDTSALRDAVAVVRAIHHRFLVLIPVLSGIDDRLKALRAEVGGVDGITREALAALADWLETGCDAQAALALNRRLEDWKSFNLAGDWKALLRHSLLTRLQDLLSDLGDAHQLQMALHVPATLLPATLSGQLAKRTRKPLHRDLGLAALSGFSAFLTIMLVCAVWIETGWTDGPAAAALAGVFCALFAALDDPAPAIIGFGVFFGVSIPVAALYQFAILPGIDGLPLLLLFLAPFYLLCGAYMLDRRTALPSLALILGFSSALAFQETFSADFAAFINSNTAIYVSLFVAILVTRAVRSISVDNAARRLLVRTWKRLAALAAGQTISDPSELAAEMIDRIGLLTPKLAAGAQQSSVRGADILTDLRIGMNIAQIQEYRATTPPEETAHLADLLRRVGTHFSALAAGRGSPPATLCLSVLDSCLHLAVSGGEATESRRSGIAALVGLRRNLFPEAPAFAHEALS
jgi:uncharacterized membrane protein YccC